MNKKIVILLLLVFITTTLVHSQTNNQLTTEKKAWLTKANRHEKNGWIIVHLEGTPEAIGYQHGYLLADEIIDLRGAMVMYYSNRTDKTWEFYRSESTRMFWPKIPEEYQKEIDGIVRGVNDKTGTIKIDRYDIIAMNSILEMSGYYVPWLKSVNNPKTPPPKPSGHCSAIAATGSWTKDGKIVMAHNNWIAYVIGERWNIILDIVPEKGNRIVMDALPGFIHSGDDFYINSSGLIVTETTITQFYGFDTSGVAEFVRARKAIQYSTSIDSWAAIMVEKNNGGYANDWLIGDNKTGEIARLELGLKNHPLEKTKDGFFTGANYPVDKKLIKEETTFDTSLTNISPNTRKLRWKELLKDYRGKIDVKEAMKFMGDHYDTFRNKDKPSGFTICGHFDDDEISATYWDQPSYDPNGAVQGKATDGNLVKEMKLWAIIGHPCGESFIAKDFFKKHPEFNYQKEYLHDMPGQVWTLFGKINK
jgi:hypothetical protein